MKKLLSILLALVMVCSLTVPAFADGPEGPAPDDYYTNWAKGAWAETCDRQPEETARFLKELPTWFAGEYGDEYSSFEKFCEDYGCVEEAYLNLYYSWLGEYGEELSKNDFLTAHGGTPGQINVMVNGKCVKFTDAAPEVTGGRTMVPFRAIFEALGAKVTYNNGGIRAVLGDKQLDLQIGSTSMTIRPRQEGIGLDSRPEDTTEFVMDCAPYAKGGRTYVPVRFIAQALGYDVQWDGYYNTAVITDFTALAEKIDKNFGVYNKLLAKNALTDKTQKSVGSGKADVTLFDTLDGDKTSKATYSYDLAASADGASGKLEYDFSGLWDILVAYIPMPLDLAGAEDHAKTLEKAKALMKGSAEIRMDLEKGKVYVSMPGLFEVLGDDLAAAGIHASKNAWLSASLESMDLDELTGTLGRTATVGKLLTAAGSASVSGDHSARNYESIQEAADWFGKLFGDARFTRKGNADVFTLTKADLEALVGTDGYTGEDLDALSKFDYTLTVKDNGDMDASVRCSMSLPGRGMGDSMTVSGKGSTRSGRSEATVELHIKNVLKATVTLEQTVTEGGKAPETAPPEDALVLPLDGTLPGGAITSPDGPAHLVTTPAD